jgi:carboxypeptidase Taq
LLVLKRRETEYLGFEGHPYDALLNDYERGCNVAMLDKTFAEIQTPLKTLLDKINHQSPVDDWFLHQQFPKKEQWEFGMKLIKDLGFDFEAGRQDISEHPFSVNFNNADVRITTRIDEHDFSNMLWSCIHETGHALYEQGLPASEYGLPLSEYTSLSIHESQSRLWENNVGRSISFWESYYPALTEQFSGQFKNLNVEQFYKGINKVQPSLIRTEADEITYHFHVMIRYELEKLMIEGSVKTHEIPLYWNDAYIKYLGVIVADDKTGCLQDVHWSHGSLGYFPTYSLGSLYAAQFYSQATKEIPLLKEEIKNGRFGALLSWLRNQIHSQGRRYTSGELSKKITGEDLNISYFLDYATEKYKRIYGFQ